MWKTLLGLFGGGEALEGNARKGRARKPKAARPKAKKISAKKPKVVARATAKSILTSRPRKAAAKRRGSRKPKFVWPTTPTKAARRASPRASNGDDGNDPNWSQPTQPLL